MATVTGYTAAKVDQLIAGVSGGGGASALNNLTDVDTTGQTTGDVLKFNGTTWVADSADTQNLHIGSTPPADTAKAWADTSGL